MVDSGTPHQSHASYLSPRCGGHDQPRRLARSWNSSQSAHSLQRELDLHLHWIHFGGRQSLPNPAYLYSRTDQVVQREENWRITAPHIRHWRQLLHLNEKVSSQKTFFFINAQCRIASQLSRPYDESGGALYTVYSTPIIHNGTTFVKIFPWLHAVAEKYLGTKMF